MTFETDSNIAELNLIDDLLGVRENIISCALLKRTGTLGQCSRRSHWKNSDPPAVADLGRHQIESSVFYNL